MDEDIFTEFEEEELKEKSILLRLLRKGYKPCGIFEGYTILVKKDKQILYDKVKDEIVKDRKYVGGEMKK